MLKISDYSNEKILEKLCIDNYDQKAFNELIKRSKKGDFYTNKIEIFYILPPQLGDRVNYKKFLLEFNVPKTLMKKHHNGAVKPFSVNYKLLLLETLIYYNIKFSNLNQKMIDELTELLPFHNFNQLQKHLYRYDNNKFKKYNEAKIKNVKMKNFDNLIDTFIENKNKLGQKSEASSFKSNLKRFKLFLSKKSYVEFIADINRKDIKDYINYLKETKYNDLINNKYRNSFIYRNLRAVYKFFNYLFVIQYSLDENDIPKKNLIKKSDFPQPNKRGIKHFSSSFNAIIKEIIFNLPEDNKNELIEKTIMILFFFTGIRKKDVCTLTKHCLIKKKGENWLRIFSNKTRQMYEIPVFDIVFEYINKCLKENTGKKDMHPTLKKKYNFLFWNKYSFDTFYNKVNDLVLRIGSIAKFKAIRKGISLNEINEIHFTAHKFRHNIAIKYIREGADISLVADLLGHNDLSMVQAYIQEDYEHANESYKDIDNELFKDLFEDEFNSINLNIIESKNELFETGAKIERVPTGWCIYSGNEPLCGKDTSCDSCSLLDEYKNEEEILEILLNDHEKLLEYNLEHSFDKKIKDEKRHIEFLKSKIQGRNKYV